MSRRILIFALLFIAGAVAGFSSLALLGKSPQEELVSPYAEVTIRSVTYKAELALTEAQKIKGLSGKPYLPQGEGMLFYFDREYLWPFWMKDMLFPIDIIWISGGKIVDIRPNLPPSSEKNPPTYTPRAPADMVFEIASGEAQRHGFAIGDDIAVDRKEARYVPKE